MKEKLALYGGKPVRKEKLFYGMQTIEKDDIEAVSKALESDLITCGPRIKELEKKLCDYTGAKYAVVVSSGTAALHCACLAAGIGRGDEVITTPLTFAASANCALYCGANVRFADVKYETMNIDPNSIDNNITERTKAVIAVDYTGQVVEIERIREICKKNNILFIEDAAHSIGSRYNGEMVGSLADMTTFSFHPVKTITGGEGGAILTNKKELYERLILFRTHAITHDGIDKKTNGEWYYDQVALGYNYRLTDFQAALLINQINKIDRFIQCRKRIAHRYDMAFSKMPEIVPHHNIEKSDTCPHLYVLRLNLKKLNCDRKTFFRALSAENVQPQVHYIPTYWLRYYQERGFQRGICPVAEKVYSEILSLPIYPKLKENDVEDVIEAVKKIIMEYRIL